MPDGAHPGPGGWNRIHLIVDDIAAEVERLRAAGLTFRNDIVTGPGGQQILLDDPVRQPDRTLPARRHLARAASGPERPRPRVGTDRVHRLRRPAGAHRAAARAVRHPARLAERRRVRGRDRSHATCCPARPPPSSRSTAPGGCGARRERSSAALSFIVPGLVLILALSALFLAASPPDWVLGAGAGVGRRCRRGRRPGCREPGPRQLATRSRAGALGRSTRSPERSPRPPSVPGVVLVLLACGAIEVTLRGAWTQPRRRCESRLAAARGRSRQLGRAARAGVGRVQGRRAVLRRRLRDHPADAARRRQRLPLDDRQPVPQRRRPRPDHPRSGRAHRRGGRLRRRRPRRRAPRRRRRVRPVVLVHPASAPTASTACAPTAQCARSWRAPARPRSAQSSARRSRSRSR